jgi:hypothetical protein
MSQLVIRDRAVSLETHPMTAVALKRTLADLTAPPQHLRQLGEVRRHPAPLYKARGSPATDRLAA